jgi:RNA polymerase sigma factor (sigma-70 family)
MTNEEIAISIQHGNKSLIPILWNQVQKLITSFAWKYYLKYASMCSAAGVTADDLIQEGYFALLDAVNSWTPESSCVFTTFLNYPIKNRFNAACGIRGNGSNVLNNSISFETPVGVDDLTLGDTLEEKENGYEAVEQSIYIQTLHIDLDKAMEKLTENQERVIKDFYYNQFPMKHIGDQIGLTDKETCRMQKAALIKMRYSKHLMTYRDEIIYRYGFDGSWLLFKNTGMSSTERAVEELDKLSNQNVKQNN